MKDRWSEVRFILGKVMLVSGVLACLLTLFILYFPHLGWIAQERVHKQDEYFFSLVMEAARRAMLISALAGGLLALFCVALFRHKK